MVYVMARLGIQGRVGNDMVRLTRTELPYPVSHSSSNPILPCVSDGECSAG